MIDEQVVRAVRADGQLSCDRLLGARARLLVDLGAEFRSEDPPRRFCASLQAPPVAVLLTVIRASWNSARAPSVVDHRFVVVEERRRR